MLRRPSPCRIGFTAAVAAVVLTAAAVAQEVVDAGRVHTPDQVATVTLAPPAVVEDNAVVSERILADPIKQVWAMPALRKDNDAPPVVYTDFIDMRERLSEDEGAGPRGLVDGWNCGGTNSVYPPDPIMAAGPSHIIVATNELFKIFPKTNLTEFVSDWSSFFSGVKPVGTFTTDPKVIYDHESGRWFLLILAIRGSDNYSWYLLAVSDDSDPNGTWMKYALDSTLNGGSSSSTWSDYPGLGACSQALYITANMYSRSTISFQYVKVRIIPKQQLLDFDPTVTWSDIWDINDPGGGKASTIQPAQHWGTPQAPFLVDSNPTNRISVFGVNDPLGSPSLTGANATVNYFSTPPDAEQLDGSPDLDTIDTRVYNAVWRNDCLYFAHNQTRSANAGVRWYQVATNTWPAIAVIAQGSIGDASVNMWFPSVAVNRYDTLAIGFCRSAVTEYAAIYYWYRLWDGTTSEPLVIHYGFDHYTGEGGSVVRWGDYTGTVVDPVDDTTFWHYNEYPNPNVSSKWRTWVQKFTVDEPPEGCPNPGAYGGYCAVDIYPNNGDGVWNYPDDDGNCVVNLNDLTQLLGHYGITAGATREDGDVYPPPDGNGVVDLADLSELIGQYGDDCN